MKLRSERTLSMALPNTATDTASATNNKPTAAPFIPPEIHGMIMPLAFEPCTIRRHIVDHLLTQHFTPSGGTHDKDIRRTAIGLMDNAEKTTYRSIRDQLTNFSLVSKEYQQHALTTERKWLARKPMDIATFRAFCADPTHTTFEHITDTIILELWPKTDFITPPHFINEGIVAPLIPQDHLDHFELEMLRRRTPAVGTLPPAAVLHHWTRMLVDLKVVGALCRLWLKHMSQLPRKVKKVKIIDKRVALRSGLSVDAAVLGAPQLPGPLPQASSRMKCEAMMGDFRKAVGEKDVVVECVA